jgi:mannose-1-phosphate guanylyltransferase/mannose-6-phosphate isomerase
MNTYFTILCGGSGTRLWPLSRKNRPKQFVPFLGNKTLLEQTIERIEPLAKNKNHIGVVTTQEQIQLIKQTAGNKIGFIVEEPCARNTGPALLYACFEIQKKDPYSIITFMHSDAFIPDAKNFREHLSVAIKYAKKNNIIATLGIIPTTPATSYGYIQADAKNITAKTCYPLKQFHEKPNQQTAEKYIKQNDMFWNPGLFIGKVSVFLQEFKTHAPEMYDAVKKYVATNSGYETVPKISFDCAVMEKTKNAVVMPCDFEWSDVGNLDVFLSLKEKFEGQTSKTLSLESSNNLVHVEGKIVALIGIKNLCIVEQDGILVIIQRDKVENVKNILPMIKENTKLL